MSTLAHQAAEQIQALIQNEEIKIGMILGSGLTSLCDDMEIEHRIPYSELPGFHQCGVVGHAAELVFARLGGVPVVCLCGRPHYYEGAEPEVFKNMIRTLKLLNCHTLLITNAAGTLNKHAEPGTLMLINDHINFQATNPFFRAPDESFGPYFLSMDKVYDVALRECLRVHAEQLGIPISEGVYIGTQGPIFETPAEIRAYRILGADAVGMSTIPDVIVGHHCGMRIVTLSILTNWAAGMSDVLLSHDVTLGGAQVGGVHAKKLLLASMQDLYQLTQQSSDVAAE